MRAPSAAFFACLLATPLAAYAQDDPDATRGVYAPGQSGDVSPLQPNGPGASVAGPATQSAGAARKDPSATRGVYAPGQSAGVSPPLQPTASGVSVPGAATPSPGSPQDDSATRGVYAPGESASVSPLQPAAPSVSVPGDATPSAGYAQDDANSARGVLRSGSVPPRLSPRADSHLARLLHSRDPRLPRRLHPRTCDARTSDTARRYANADPGRAWIGLRCGQRSTRHH